MKSKFFEEVSKIATAKGFEDKGVEHGMLQLHLNGELAAQVDESWMISALLVNEFLKCSMQREMSRFRWKAQVLGRRFHKEGNQWDVGELPRLNQTQDWMP